MLYENAAWSDIGDIDLAAVGQDSSSPEEAQPLCFLSFSDFFSHFAVALRASRPMFGRWNAVTPISHITGDTWIGQITFPWHGQRGYVNRAQVK